MRKRLPITAAAVALVAATAAPAFAAAADQSHGTTVSTASVAPGTRQLQVLDLAGKDLTNLALQPGVAQPFRVSVVDNAITDLTSQAPFAVTAVMNNLYQANDQSSYNWNTRIPSSDVTIAFPNAGALSAYDVDVTDAPQILLSGNVPSCSSLTTILNLDLLSLASLFKSLCGVGGVLIGGPLPIPANTPVTSTLKGAVQGLADLTQLPYSLGGAAGGKFDNADYTTGIGSADSSGGGAHGTPRTILTAGQPSSLTGLITALGYNTALPLVSADGTGAMTSITNLLGALSDAGFTSLVTALAPLSNDQIDAIFNSAGVLKTLNTTTGTLTGESGIYNAFPSLTVSPSNTSLPAGTYSGTLTITMVQQ